ncbi:MAG: NAD-dependent succinate-semialdehyde dehydrogenase [Sphingobacterium sp.]
MKNSLLIEKAYHNGSFITAKNKFEVINPSNQKVIGQLPDLQQSDCKQFIISAHQAWKSWKETSVTDRANLLNKLASLVDDHKVELAEIMTLESGKPIQESLTEVDYANSFISWFAEESKRSYGVTIPPIANNFRMQTIKQGIGVVAAITPWNFPLAMITRKLAPALASGCTIVIKPASQTPFSAIALAKLANQAGFPKGVINVITSTNSQAMGEELAKNELVRKITFTGSTAVGKILMEQAASTIKRISLELGGNAPFLVFNDADIDKAVAGAIAGKFRNTGQTCVSINRFYIQDKVYDDFSKKLTKAVKALQVGDGLDKNTQIGPLINAKGLEKVKEHIKDALDKGAKLATGGHNIKDLFFEPTVLTNMDQQSKIAKEETFGPVCALFKFTTEQEAIELANDTPFGLASYFYSENIHQCIRVSEQLEAGMVGINTGLISNSAAPFGGVKQSGLGREGSKYGLDEYQEIKYICYGI